MTYSAALLFALATPVQASPDLARLEAEHRYFELRDAVAKRKGADLDTLYYRGLTRGRFGDYRGAEADLKGFLAKIKDDPKRSAEANLMLATVYSRTFRYRDAVRALDDALGPFGTGLDAEEKENAANVRVLWNAVADVPAQTVHVARGTTVRFKRTIGLRVPITVGEKETDFIFDTGANISCLSTTMANQIGARIRPDVIQVGTITGKKSPARLAEIPEMRLGDVTIRHAIALVFEDKDVTIPNTTIRLDAILGFPVIFGLRQFSLTRDGELRVAARPGPRRGTDMCLDGLTPLIQATAFGKVGTYSVDSGASHTHLWPPFFRDNEAHIRAKGTEEREPITGVGGTRHVSAWRLPSLTLTIAGKEARLVGPKILTEAVVDHSKYLHGNLGQDLIRQFDRVTFNFERMTVEVE